MKFLSVSSSSSSSSSSSLVLSWFRVDVRGHGRYKADYHENSSIALRTDLELLRIGWTLLKLCSAGVKNSIVLFLFIIGCGLCSDKEVNKELPPCAITPLGTIEGYYKNSNGGRRYEAYEGIPYAHPPTGEFRFKIPRPVSPWTGVLMAKEPGSACIQHVRRPRQKSIGVVTGSENCLYLNIYTAIVSDCTACQRLPVIVFIHGGIFQFGSGDQYGPKYILDHNVILVTINYRLGPLGFLSTEDETVPGNMGLKDQVMALHWVKENIRFFGGDPSRVTIVGQSAGAASVHYHMLSKLSKGLFQRAISLSGTALNCWTQAKSPLEKAKKLATILECPSDNIARMVDCLKIRPADQIADAVEEFMPFFHNPITPFGPVVEKGNSEFTFIDRPPIEIITSGKIPQDVPWITGVVSEEGLATASEFVIKNNTFDELDKNWELYAPYLLDFNYTIPKANHSAVARLIRQHYLGDRPINKSSFHRLVKMIGDRLFAVDAEKAARLQARANRSPVRFYYFTYRGAHSFSETLTGSKENFGVCHKDDLEYVLDADFDPTTTAQDREMQKVLINMWTSFATNGQPNVGVEWPRLRHSRTNKLHYLHIAGPKKIAMRSTSNFGEKNFWRTIDFWERTLY